MQATKQHSTTSQRQQHIDAWNQSGLSQQDYCKQTGINYYTFNSWITKMHMKPSGAVKFMPVEIAPYNQPASQKFATLTMSNQTIIELHQSVSAHFIKQLAGCR